MDHFCYAFCKVGSSELWESGLQEASKFKGDHF